MPKRVSEISAGAQFARSMEEGRVADSQTRTFRVLLEAAGEVINIQEACGVFIGDQHPYNTNIYCSSFDARFDGDSRMVLLCTFNYGTKAGSGGGGQDPQSQPPDIRPANWSVSSAIYEAPAYFWKPLGNAPNAGEWRPTVNTAGDRYDGVTEMECLITFSIDQWEPENPARWAAYAGRVNSADFTIGTFTAQPRMLMLRGVSCQPAVESWGGQNYRGWKATYEIVYKANYAGPELGHIGWDIAIPQTGFNVINKSAALGGGVHEIGSLALEHDSSGKIKDWPDDPSLVPGTDGKKVRGMVLVHAYEEGGASQTPCAQPIPLNDDGTPRASTADPPVKVYRYQVQGEFDFADLNIRLE